jgi:hypothetical protein
MNYEGLHNQRQKIRKDFSAKETFSTDSLVSICLKGQHSAYDYDTKSRSEFGASQIREQRSDKAQQDSSRAKVWLVLSRQLAVDPMGFRSVLSRTPP